MATDGTPTSMIRLAPLLRRWLVRVSGAVGVVLVLLVASFVGLRWYFDDERLRSLVERVGSEAMHAQIRLGGLDLNLLGYLELRDVRVGAPEGFSNDALTVALVRLRWDAWELLRLRVVVEELRVQGVSATLEHDGARSNLDAMLVAEPKGDPEAPHESAPEELELPVDVLVREVRVSEAALAYVAPSVRASLAGVHAQAQLDSTEGPVLLGVQLGVGQPAAPGALAVHADGLELAAQPTLAVHVAMRGLGGVSLKVDLHSAVSTSGPVRLNGAPLELSLASRLDLLRQAVDVERLELRWRAQTRAIVRATAKQGVVAPEVAVQELDVTLALEELAELAAALVPGARVAGTLTATSQNLLGSVAAPAAAAAAIMVGGRDLLVSHRDALVRVPALDVAVGLADQRATLRGEAKLEARAAGAELRGAMLAWEASTPVAPWLDALAAADEPLRAQMTLTADRAAASSAAVVAGAHVTVRAALPVAMLRGQGQHKGQVELGARLARASAGGAEVRGVELAVGMTPTDLAGEHMHTNARLRVGDVSVPVGATPVRLGPLVLEASGRRQGDTAALDALRGDVGGLVRWDAKGKVSGMTSTAPVVQGLRAELGLPDLRGLAGVSPELMGGVTLGGAMTLSAHLDGAVPYGQLLARVQPPAVHRGQPDWWLGAVRGYVDFIEEWAAVLRRGLPFRARASLTLRDVGVVTPQLTVGDADGTLTLDVTPKGPKLAADVTVGAFTQPERLVSDLQAHLAFSVLEDRMSLDASGRTGELAELQGDAVEPVRDLTWRALAEYRLRGDLVLRELSLLSAPAGLSAQVDAVVTRPLQVFLEESWSRPGLPGLELAWRGEVALDRPRPLVLAGMKLGGQAGVRLEARVANGAASVRGRLHARELSLGSSQLEVTSVTGAIPVDVSLAFEPRPDVAVLARDLPFGVVGVQVAGADARSRPARPAYYERLTHYRPAQGLRVARIRSGAYELRDLVLEGRLERGGLVLDRLAMRVLGGDVAGNAAFQLGPDAGLRGDLSLRVSHIDASTFEALSLQPGPESELNADLAVGFLFAPGKRDLSLTTNVTKIGSKTLDRFLLLMDPEERDETIADARDNLALVNIRRVAVWVRYELLNMDLDYTTFLSLPGVTSSDWPVPRELIRRYPLGNYLDVYVQPYVDEVLAPALGWRRGG